MSTDPADMLGPTVTPATEHAYPDVRRELLRRAADRNSPALARLATPPAGEDVYQAAYDAYRAIPGPIDLNQTRIRAVVDTAVRITEERVRAEYAEPLDPEPILRRAEEATRRRDAEVEQRVRDEMAAEYLASVNLLTAQQAECVAQLERRMQLVEVDRDTLIDRLARAEAPLSTADLAQLTGARAGDKVTASDIRRLARDLVEARAERDEVEAQGLAQVDDLNGRLHRAERDRRAAEERGRLLGDTLTQVLGAFHEHGYPGRACRRTGWISEDNLRRWAAVLTEPPASPLCEPLSGEQASVVPPDPNSPEGGSGGRS